MFDNLVESSSHKDDIQRKGSFIGVTALIYGVLMIAFFVAGIYWYDAKLGEMELELTTLVAPVPVPQVQKEPEQKQEAKPQKVEQNVDVRKELVADVTRTELVPKEVSAKASDVPPVRRGVTTVIGTSDSNAQAPMPSGPGSGTGIVAGPTKVEIADNRRHPLSQLLAPLPSPAACSMVKRSAYPSRRIRRLPRRHMLRARW